MSSVLASLTIVLLAADVALKSVASLGIHVKLLGNFLSFGLVTNPDLAFGVPASDTFALVLNLLLFLLVVAAALTRTIVGSGRGYWLLIIGIAGGLNLADRFLYGAVRDYLVFSFPFPIFNFADLAIFFGIFGFLGSFERKQTPGLKPHYVVPR